MNEEAEIVANEEPPKSIMVDPDKLGDWGNDTRIIEPGDVIADVEEEPGNEENLPAEELVAPLIVAAEPVEVADPGQFVPKDYSFEVTVFDKDGKNPKVHKIATTDEFDDLMDTDPDFGTGTALTKAMRAATKMEVSQASDRRDYDLKKSAYDAAAKQSTEGQAAAQMMVNEMTYLTERGDLPKVDAKYVNADWSDPEVAKQPGVKEQIEIMNIMVRESKIREKAGLPKVTSILEGHRIWKDEQRTRQASDTKRVAGEARRAAGARVAGPTPNPTRTAPKGISVGQGGSLRDLSTTNWG